MMAVAMPVTATMAIRFFMSILLVVVVLPMTVELWLFVVSSISLASCRVCVLPS
jgi:hypothetical protein